MVDLDSFQGLEGDLRLDAHGAEAGYLLVAPNGTHLRLSPSAFHLLTAVRSGLGFEALAAALSRQGRVVTVSELRAAWQRLAAELAAAARRTPRSLPPGFRWRRRLLPEPVVARLASRLTSLFAPWLWPGVLAAFVGAAVSLFAAGGFAPLADGAAFWPAYVLFVVSLLAHELGHASAGARFGARPSDIGLAVYLIFPAFYSDVTRAWRLRRWQRVAVDFGGIYFQLLVALAYASAFYATGWPAWRTAFWMILLSCLFSLNPVFRFDGYWALADALGVTGLGREPGRLVRHAAALLRGRKPRPWPWPARITAVLAAYTMLAIGVWAFFLWRLAPELWARALDYPAQALAVAASVASWTLPDADTVQALLVSTFLLLLSGLLARQALRRSAALLAQKRSA